MVIGKEKMIEECSAPTLMELFPAVLDISLAWFASTCYIICHSSVLKCEIVYVRLLVRQHTD